MGVAFLRDLGGLSPNRVNDTSTLRHYVVLDWCFVFCGTVRRVDRSCERSVLQPVSEGMLQQFVCCVEM